MYYMRGNMENPTMKTLERCFGVSVAWLHKRILSDGGRHIYEGLLVYRALLEAP